MSDTVKLIIEIPKKTIAHIRSDYGHGYKGLYDEDRDKIVDAIYHSTPLDSVKAELANINTFERAGCFVWKDVMQILNNIGKEGED